jgi:hypothetical protein
MSEPLECQNPRASSTAGLQKNTPCLAADEVEDSKPESSGQASLAAGRCEC